MNEHIKTVCKIGHGKGYCKYLVIGGNGFECMKSTLEGKDTIDRAWETTPHTAHSDNCEGKKDLS